MKILGPYQTIIFKSRTLPMSSHKAVHSRITLNRSAFWIEYCVAEYQDTKGFFVVFNSETKYHFNILYNAKDCLDKILFSEGYDILSDNDFNKYKLLS